MVILGNLCFLYYLIGIQLEVLLSQLRFKHVFNVHLNSFFFFFLTCGVNYRSAITESLECSRFSVFLYLRH